MIQKIKSYVLILVSMLTLAAPMAMPVVAHAANNDATLQGLCGGSNLTTTTANNCNQTSGSGASKLQTLLTNVVNIISIIVGIVAVIMIIFGGFKYITSGGDSNNVSSAKNTIIYAIIGLIIVALAQLIVHFVLGATQNAIQG